MKFYTPRKCKQKHAALYDSFFAEKKQETRDDSTARSRQRQQAVGALGEPSDKSDFSLHVWPWDSFSQEIRDLLFLFYGQKSLIYLKCSDFLPKKEEICYFL